MYVKAINLLLLCDFTSFLPTMELFDYSLPLLLRIYYENKKPLRDTVEKTLFNIIKNTNVFNGCENEIKTWLYSLLECSVFEEDIGIFFASSIKLTSENFLHYCKILNKIRDTISEEQTYNFKEIIENLSIDICKSKTDIEKAINIRF